MAEVTELPARALISIITTVTVRLRVPGARQGLLLT